MPLNLLGVVFGCINFGTLLLVKGLLQPSEFIVEVDEYISARDLHKGVVSRLEEDDVLFIKVLEEGITEDLIDTLPVARNQALFVKVNKVALDLLARSLSRICRNTINQVITDLIALNLLEGVAEGLKFL